MDSLHNLGLTWAAVIPCTAVLLRGALSYYLIALPQRKTAQQRAAVTPLIHAYGLMHQERPVEREKLNKILRSGANRWDLAIYGMGVRFRGWVRGWWELGWLSGIGRWKFFGQKVGQFGILLTVMEAIRVKCGSGEGLLALVFSPFVAVGNGVQALTHRGQDSVALEQVARLQQQYDITKGVPAGSAATTLPPQTSAETTPFDTALQPLPPPDPTLQTEGLSFCPDLTLADPTGILPQCLLATILLTAYFSPRALEPNMDVRTGSAHIRNVVDSLPGTITANPAARAAREAKLHRTLNWLPWPFNKMVAHVQALPFPQRIAMFVGMYFYFIAQGMPAGMVLYLVCSWSVGWVQRVWLDVRFPAVSPILPCSRPVRVKRRAP